MVYINLWFKFVRSLYKKHFDFFNNLGLKILSNNWEYSLDNILPF